MVDLADPRVFEAVVDSLETGVYLVDHDRKIVYWNRGAERISGYKRHDVTGRFCRDDLTEGLFYRFSAPLRLMLLARWSSAVS